MILSSVLEAVKDYLYDSSIFSYDKDQPYRIQITPDERPFPYSGPNTITIYPVQLTRESITSDQRKFNSNFSISVNRKITTVPHDRQYYPLYLDTFSSLSNISEIIAYTLDLNNTLLNNITNKYNTNKLSTSETLQTIEDSSNTDSSGISEEVSINLLNSSSIEPIRVLEITAAPIPRFDDFFTAYNTKKDYDRPFENNRIQPSGYSMIINFQGPSVVLEPFC